MNRYCKPPSPMIVRAQSVYGGRREKTWHDVSSDRMLRRVLDIFGSGPVRPRDLSHLLVGDLLRSERLWSEKGRIRRGIAILRKEWQEAARDTGEAEGNGAVQVECTSRSGVPVQLTWHAKPRPHPRRWSSLAAGWRTCTRPWPSGASCACRGAILNGAWAPPLATGPCRNGAREDVPRRALRARRQ